MKAIAVMDQGLKRAAHERAEQLVDTAMTARKLTAIVVLALLSTTPCAAKDMFNAIMQFKDGTVEDHNQMMTSEKCDAALAAFRAERKAGHEFVLTLEDPVVTGVVLEMACIDPDGVIRGPDGIVRIPTAK